MEGRQEKSDAGFNPKPPVSSGSVTCHIESLESHHTIHPPLMQPLDSGIILTVFYPLSCRQEEILVMASISTTIYNFCEWS